MDSTIDSKLYKEIAGKKYRLGYTTGTCAAAATKAAVILMEHNFVDFVDINTPYGLKISINVIYKYKNDKFSICAVKKYSGDDYDVTDGIDIFARVEYSDKKTSITGGIGIGIVTKNGLRCDIGKYAINPEPIKMIKDSICEVSNNNFNVQIYIPKGEEISIKTFNQRLGIIGGLSIIGTTGIIIPMSEEAWKQSCSYELSIKKAEHKKHVCFVFGNYGEVFAKNYLNIYSGYIVSISNFVGYMLDTALNMDFKSILIVGHSGKLIKISGGVFNTHSKIADCRMEVLCTILGINGANKDIIEKVYNCTTTDMAEKIIKENNFSHIWEIAANIAEYKCLNRTLNKINIGCIIFNNNNEILAKSKSVDKIIYNLRR